MTHRIDRHETRHQLLLEVQGVVDGEALAGLQAALAEAGARPVTVVIKEGSEVEPSVVAQLRRLEGVELVAESPFLARWLRNE